mmetsp:Transcript_8783/g.39023  ORF Transcript_8783/g.39023 Transcript_8783/m.39023 type:complete len:183 (-) Transcript_8783:730-1278(-)
MLGFCVNGKGSISTATTGARALCPRRVVTIRCQDDAPVVWKGIEISSNPAAAETVLGPLDVLKELPHRYPFLLVDRVVDLVGGESIVGIKNVTFNEPQFTGHFPENPIFPGVMMIEALAQLSGILLLQPPLTENKEDIKAFFFAGIDKVKFRRPITPGDTLVLESKVTNFKQRFGIAKFATK